MGTANNISTLSSSCVLSSCERTCFTLSLNRGRVQGERAGRCTCWATQTTCIPGTLSRITASTLPQLLAQVLQTRASFIDDIDQLDFSKGRARLGPVSGS